jgi:hypothetical protein
VRLLATAGDWCASILDLLVVLPLSTPNACSTLSIQVPGMPPYPHMHPPPASLLPCPSMCPSPVSLRVSTMLVLLAINPPPPLSSSHMVGPVVLMICREVTMSSLREWAAAAGEAAHKVSSGWGVGRRLGGVE